MKALVAYESLYGNTAAIGQAIATSLRDHGLEVEAGPISTIDAGRAAEADLVIVGGPTHAHGMSRPSTRKVAAGDKKNTFLDPTVAAGVREWMEALPEGEGRLAAAFDTRIDRAVLITGTAAKGIARRLKGRGYRLVVGPECFLVTTENRTAAGEDDHTLRWAAEVAERAAHSPGAIA